MICVRGRGGDHIVYKVIRIIPVQHIMTNSKLLMAIDLPQDLIWANMGKDGQKRVTKIPAMREKWALNSHWQNSRQGVEL